MQAMVVSGTTDNPVQADFPDKMVLMDKPLSGRTNLKSASQPASMTVVLEALSVVEMSNHEAAMGAEPSVRTLATKTAQVPREDPLQLVALAVQAVGHPSGVAHATFPLGSIRFLGWLVRPAQMALEVSAPTPYWVRHPKTGKVPLEKQASTVVLAAAGVAADRPRA